MKTEAGQQLDPVLLAVLANRLDGICREMTNTLLRSGRSAVLNMARDFSCALVTAERPERSSVFVISRQMPSRRFASTASSTGSSC